MLIYLLKFMNLKNTILFNVHITTQSLVLLTKLMLPPPPPPFQCKQSLDEDKVLVISGSKPMRISGNNKLLCFKLYKHHKNTVLI